MHIILAFMAKRETLRVLLLRIQWWQKCHQCTYLAQLWSKLLNHSKPPSVNKFRMIFQNIVNSPPKFANISILCKFLSMMTLADTSDIHNYPYA